MALSLARGLSVEQAERRVAAVLGEHDAEPAEQDDHAGTDVVGSALAAAGSSFVAFAGGAAIPILPFLVVSGTTAIAAASVLVGAALFAVGVLTGGPLLRRGPSPARHRRCGRRRDYALGRLFRAAVG